MKVSKRIIAMLASLAIFLSLFSGVSSNAYENSSCVITMKSSSILLYTGKSEKLFVNVFPDEGQTIVWRSSDETVATVDSDGVVNATSLGLATITAYAGSASAECKVTVKEGYYLEGKEELGPIGEFSILDDETLELDLLENKSIGAIEFTLPTSYKVYKISKVTNGWGELENYSITIPKETKRFSVSEGYVGKIIIPSSWETFKAGVIDMDWGSAGIFVIEDGISAIEDYAFGSFTYDDYATIQYIYIPDSVTSIGDNAFYGLRDFTIFCTRDSYAYDYAQEKGYKVLVKEGSSDTDKAVESIEVVKAPDKLQYVKGYDGYTDYHWDEESQEYKEYDEYNLNNYREGFQLKINYVDGSNEIYSYNDEYSDYFNDKEVEFITNQEMVPWDIGRHKVTVSYMSKTTSFYVEVIENPVKSIEVLRVPDKTQFIINSDGEWLSRWDDESQEEVDFFYYYAQSSREGFQLRVNYTDGSSGVYSYNDDNSYYFNGYPINFDSNQYEEPWELGSHEVTVSYLGKSTSFPVEVIENPVKSIEVIKAPDKTQYMKEAEGYWRSRWDDERQEDMEYFYYSISDDRSGFQMKVNYSDGSTGLYSYDEEYSHDYKGYNVKFDTDQYEKPWDLGSHEVTVEYMGQKSTFNVEVIESPIASIEVIKAPDKVQYIKEYDGYWNYRWDDEADEDIEYYRYWAEDNREGFELKINYTDGATATYAYNDDYEYDFKGYPVEFSTNQYEEPWDIGSHEVTVSYLDKSTSFSVEVIENSVESIEVTKAPDKVQYVKEDDGYWNTRWDYDSEEETKYFRYDVANNREGLEVTVHYIDGTSAVYSYDDTHDYDFNGYYVDIDSNQYEEPWDIGSHEVIVSYLGRSTTFTVEVVESPVESIEVVKAPNKIQFIEGADGYYSRSYDSDNNSYSESFEYDVDNPQGLQLRINYSNGDSELFDYKPYRNNSLNGYEFTLETDQYENPWTVGKHKVYVKYLGRYTSYEVEVVESPVESIEITSTPSRSQYIVGYDDSYSIESNLQGLAFTINYKDGTTAEYSYDKDNLEFNGYNVYINALSYDLLLGSNTVRVHYMGAIADFSVEAIESNVESIELIKSPSATEYLEGQYPDMTGAELKINYTDGSSYVYTFSEESDHWNAGSTRIKGYQCNYQFAQGSAVPEKDNIVISYLGATTSCSVTVEEYKVDSIKIIKAPSDMYGTGMIMRVQDSKGNTDDYTIQAVDIRYGGGGRGLNHFGGLVKTDKGIFDGYDIERSYKDSITSEYSVTFLGQKDTLTSVPLADAKEITSVAMMFASEHKLNPMYQGIITKDNIDTVCLMAIILSDDAWENSDKPIAEEALVEKINKFFDCDSIDLTLSDKFDEATREYNYELLGYENDGIDVTVEENPEGGWIATYLDDNGYIKEAYIYFNEDLKITAIQSSKIHIKAIEIEVAPKKLSYYKDEKIDLAGLKLMAVYSDGSKKEITEGYNVAYDFSSVGAKTVTITYKDLKTTFEVEVLEEKNEFPVISGAEDITILQGSRFNSKTGVSAYDEQDGDLTSRIRVSGSVSTYRAGEYKLTYTVTDRDGNKTKVIRIVTVRANNKPVISASSRITLKVGDEFDPLVNVTATDKEDGDITALLTIDKTVDTSKKGYYKITYSVTDSDGNTTKKNVTVVVR